MPTSDPNGDLPPGSPPPADAEKVARAFDRRQGQSDASEFFVSLERSMPTTWVTWSMMTINVAVFLALLVAGVHWMEPTAGDLLRFGADWAPRTRGGQWWRLLTSTFLHVGLIHLLVNMYSLKVLGPLAERLLGHAGFLLTYLVAGVTGSLASNAFGPGVVSAGASGSIFGLFGVLLAFTVAAPKETVPAEARRRLRSITLQNLLLNLFIGFSASRINNYAHVGGLVGGFLCGLPLAMPPGAAATATRGRRLGLVAAASVLGIVLSAWLLRADDLERVLEHAKATERQALAAYDAVVKKSRAHQLGAKGVADTLDREVVARYAAIDAEVRGADRVTKPQQKWRDAAQGLSAKALLSSRQQVAALRVLERLEEAQTAAWQAQAEQATGTGRPLPAPPAPPWAQLEKLLPARSAHFEERDGGR